MKRSTTRLVAIAQVRAPTMAAVAQPTVHPPGQPPAARTIAIYAKGRAKTVCANLIASSTRATRFRGRSPSSSEAVVLPAPGDELTDLVRHHDLLGPGLHDVVERALLGRVDPELAAESVAERGVIEVVHRALEHHEVALRVDVAGGAPGDLREIVDVHAVADDDDRLRQHHEPHAPERRHDLARVTGIALLDRDDHEVVEDALGRHVDVDDFGQQ